MNWFINTLGSTAICAVSVLMLAPVGAVSIGRTVNDSWPFRPEQLTSLEGISDACLSREKDYWTQRRFNENDKLKEACATLIASRLPKLDPSNRYYFGEHYKPERWLECEKSKLKYPSPDRRDPFYQDNCNRYALLRVPNPEYWPYPEKGKPKFPEAPATPTWQEGMTGEQYHKALCDKEAGEVIHRSVEDVESFYVIRPRNKETEAHENDRYVVEHPWGITLFGTAGTLLVDDVPGEQHRIFYRFTERGFPRSAPTGGAMTYDASYYAEPPPGAKFERYFIKELGKWAHPNKKEYDTAIKSRYGLYWRAIERPNDREHGIAGGEFFVIDLETNEILGWQRQFMRAWRQGKYGYSWLSAQACPLPTKGTSAFLAKVLVPTKEGIGKPEAVSSNPAQIRGDK